ncbi:MAG TPA: hypothetical protein VGF24_09920 [Vicinamibacterales bacterium]
MARVLLALWLGLFAMQATDVLAFVAPDDCVGGCSSSRDDACQTGTCMRCVCCARTVAPVTPVTVVLSSTASVVVDVPSFTEFVPSPDPRGILHIPKALL